MQSVILNQGGMSRRLTVAVGALLLIAASTATFADFRASAPGLDLDPVGGAATVIDLAQGNEAVLWSALTGTVVKIHTQSWPTSDGTHELGGALVLERPAKGLAGVVDLGEKPMSMTFTVDG